MIDPVLYDEMCSVFFPIFKKLSVTDVYSITLGGSHGKGIASRASDFDFRIYYETPIESEKMKPVFEEVSALCDQWKARDVKVDGIFPRSYAEVDAQLDLWLNGHGKLVPYEWTVWGYNILTDIYNQQIIEDPYGRAAQWKERLSVYPHALKESQVNHYGSSLEYWRNDYHYLNKVNQGDIVFLAYITCRLVQDIVQIIYALNAFYYPGDGMNLKYSQPFAIKPSDFEARITAALQPTPSNDRNAEQYNTVIGLIDDTLLLVKKYREGTK